MSHNPGFENPREEDVQNMPETSSLDILGIREVFREKGYDERGCNKSLRVLEEQGADRRKVLEFMLRSGMGMEVGTHATWFLKDIPTQELVDRLLEQKQGVEYVIDHIENFPELNHELFFEQALQSENKGWLVSRVEKLHLDNLDATIVRMGEERLFKGLVEREDADEVFGLDRLAMIAIEYGQEATFLSAYNKTHTQKHLNDALVGEIAKWYAQQSHVKDRSRRISQSAEMGASAVITGGVYGKVRQGESHGSILVPRKEDLQDAIAFYSGLPPEASVGCFKDLDRRFIRDIQSSSKDEAEKTGKSEEEIEREWFDQYPDLELIDKLRLSEGKLEAFMQSEDGRGLIRKVQEMGKRRLLLKKVQVWQFWNEHQKISPESRRVLLDVTLDSAPERFVYDNSQSEIDRVYVGGEVSSLPDEERSLFIDRWIEKDVLGVGVAYLGQKATPTQFDLSDEQRARLVIAAFEQNSVEDLFRKRARSQHHFLSEFLDDTHKENVYRWLLNNRAGEIGFFGRDILEGGFEDLYEQTMNTAFREGFQIGVNLMAGTVLKKVEVSTDGSFQEKGFKGKQPDIDKKAMESGIEKAILSGEFSELERKLDHLKKLRADYSGDVPFPDHPWVSVMERLKKIQARSAREDLDPWIRELDPLMKVVFGLEPIGRKTAQKWGGFKKEEQHPKSFMSPESAEDGDILIDFVKEFGMLNIPRLFETFTYLKQAEQKTDVPEVIRRRLREFLGEGRYGKLKEPQDLLHELVRARGQMTQGLLNDEIPHGLGTEIGNEIFNAVRGSTQWEKGDDPKVLADIWTQFAERNPEQARVPEGYQEVELQVRRRSQTDLGEEEARLQREHILGSASLNKIMTPYVETLAIGDLDVFKESGVFERGLVWIRTEVNQKLSRIQERLEKIMNPIDVAKMKFQEKKLLEQQDVLKSLLATQLSVFEDGYDEDDVLQNMMEELLKLDAKKTSVQDLLRLVSARHIGLKAPDDMMRGIESCEGPLFEEKDVRGVNTLLQDFVFEHYLHPDQDPKHTGHKSFSKDLYWYLAKIWGKSTEAKQHSLQKVVAKLEALSKGELLEETTSVTMVPNQGLLRVMSGDTGDACYTSQHQNLAQGEFPDLHAYTFVVGRSTAKEKFVGSVLFIEATTGNGEERVLNVRANNPRENLLQSIDGEDLILQILEEAIATAKRRGIDCVCVPLDSSSASSSNRPAVSGAYLKWFGNSYTTSLKNTPETNFNGYDNHNMYGAHAVVEIWNRQEGKNGNWPS